MTQASDAGPERVAKAAVSGRIVVSIAVEEQQG
jgi:hypothetical protein